MRVIPDSLVGRTILVLCLGLVLVTALVVGFFSADRVRALVDVTARRIAEQASVLYPSMERASPQARVRLAHAASQPALAARWLPNLLDEGGEDNWQSWLVRLAVQDALPGLAEDAVRITVYPSQARRERWREHGESIPSGSERMPGDQRSGPPALGRGGATRDDWVAPHLRWMASSWRNSPLVEVAMRLSDGTWLALATPLPRSRTFLATPLLGPILLSGIVVLLLSVWAVRRAVRPLAAFAAAAERLGCDVRAAPLAESGPREVREAAQAFNGMQQRLRAFVEDRTEMLAAISHDLRTPITRLRLRAEFIEQPDQQKKVLLDLAEMEAMIDAALAFARDDAEHEAKRMLDLRALAETVCDNARDAGLDAQFIGGEAVRVHAAPMALKRALTNLVDNATKYGKCARVSLAATAEHGVISVDDDGPGIPPSEVERAFRPFYRLERSRNRATGGAGLGLSVARSVARSHGGDVTLENRPEGGLRAILTVPLSGAAAS